MAIAGIRRGGIDERKKWNLFSGIVKPAGHGMSHHAAETIASETIRSLRLKSAQVG
jgi:hypothetical protein